MSYTHYIRRGLTLPPHVAARKALGLLRRRLRSSAERKRDLTQATYAADLPFAKTRIARYLKPLSREALAGSADVRARLADNYMTHTFDLLGSGWTKSDFEAPVSGLEGYRYGSGDVPVPDAEGDWLYGRVTQSNEVQAGRLWRMIGSDYTPIDWQRDLRSGFRWSESTLSREIVFGATPGADIKLPWELGRLQHAPILALSHASATCGLPEFDAPDRYLGEFCNQVLDFAAQNPPRFGVQWACPMDVALRAANLAIAYDLFVAHGARFDGDFVQALATSLFEHGRHIYGNLEWNDALRGNHFLCNLAGLIFIGAYLPSCDETDGWLTYGARRLTREVADQFHPDGTSFEGSTSYHRLSAETVLYATALLWRLRADAPKRLAQDAFNAKMAPPGWEVPSDNRGVFEFPEGYLARLRGMPRFTAAIAHRDGQVPQFGDNDNGRFVKLDPALSLDESGVLGEEAQQDHRHLVEAFRSLVRTSGCAVSRRTRPGVESEVLRGLSGSEEPPITAPQPVLDAAGGFYRFPHFGLYVWKTDKMYLAIRCGDIGQNGFGGHTHNDQLSFEFAAYGTPFVVDAGTFVYSSLPDARNAFRSTAMHNTLSVEGMEQAGWDGGLQGLFSLRSDPHAQALEADRDGFSGQHFGFGSPHRRTVRLVEDGFDAIDECNVPERKTIHFHFHPETELGGGLDSSTVLLKRASAEIELSTEDASWVLEKSAYSPSYGLRHDSIVLKLASVPERCAWQIRIR